MKDQVGLPESVLESGQVDSPKAWLGGTGWEKAGGGATLFVHSLSDEE